MYTSVLGQRLREASTSSPTDHLGCNDQDHWYVCIYKYHISNNLNLCLMDLSFYNLSKQHPHVSRPYKRAFSVSLQQTFLRASYRKGVCHKDNICVLHEQSLCHY